MWCFPLLCVFCGVLDEFSYVFVSFGMFLWVFLKNLGCFRVFCCVFWCFQYSLMNFAKRCFPCVDVENVKMCFLVLCCLFLYFNVFFSVLLCFFSFFVFVIQYVTVFFLVFFINYSYFLRFFLYFAVLFCFSDFLHVFVFVFLSGL